MIFINKINKLTILLALLGSSCSFNAQAETLNLNDFSHSATLTKGNSALRQLELPLSLLKIIQRNDYGDLRVFNADGQIAPHQIILNKKKLLTQYKSLIFHPLSKEQTASSNTIQIKINQKTGEQQLKINQEISKDNNPNDIEYQYIVENTLQKIPLCGLKLTWKQKDKNSIVPFSLESSDDFKRWSKLGEHLNISRFTITHSTKANNITSNDEVRFTCTQKKYLRLRWRKPQQIRQLNIIEGLYRQGKPAKTQWANWGKPKYIASKNNNESQSNNKNHWLFERESAGSIDRLAFIAPQSGLLYTGRLYSRNTLKSPWRFLQTISQFKLDNLQSSHIRLSSNYDRYWKVELDAESRFNESQLPNIQVAWTQQKIIFLAQGNPPFTLAIGNADITPPKDNALNSLLALSNNSIETISLGEIAKNSTYQKNNNKDKLPWKLILFWIMLIAGTALLGFMAFRLFKQMDKVD